MPVIPVVTFSVQDAKGKIGKVRFYVTTTNWPDPGYLFENVRDYAVEASRRLDPLILGAITSLDVSFSVRPHIDCKAMPLAVSDVEEKALFVYHGSAARFSHNIPTFNHALFPPGGEQMSIDHTEELAYYGLYIGDPSLALDNAGGFGGITDNRGVYVVDQEALIYKRFRP